jgi:hypothetical protein
MCGGINLHHESVIAIFRDTQDGPGTSVESDHDGVSVTRMADNEIPGRRDVVVITFMCEKGCPKARLVIAQHKGTTMFEWQPGT